jgi:hypothetical protein
MKMEATGSELYLKSEIGHLLKVNQALADAIRTAMALIQEYRMAFDDYGLFLGTDNKRIDEALRAAIALANVDTK